MIDPPEGKGVVCFVLPFPQHQSSVSNTGSLLKSIVLRSGWTNGVQAPGWTILRIRVIHQGSQQLACQGNVAQVPTPSPSDPPFPAPTSVHKD